MKDLNPTSFIQTKYIYSLETGWNWRAAKVSRTWGKILQRAGLRVKWKTRSSSLAPHHTSPESQVFRMRLRKSLAENSIWENRELTEAQSQSCQCRKDWNVSSSQEDGVRGQDMYPGLSVKIQKYYILEVRRPFLHFPSHPFCLVHNIHSAVVR